MMRCDSDQHILKVLWEKLQHGSREDGIYHHPDESGGWWVCWGLHPAHHVRVPPEAIETFRTVGDLADFLDTEYGIARVVSS